MRKTMISWWQGLGLAHAIFSSSAKGFVIQERTTLTHRTFRAYPKPFSAATYLSASADLGTVPRLSPLDLEVLNTQGYVIVDNFIPEDLQQALRDDVQSLRKESQFAIAKIGQDATNTLNTNIRVAETCFLGPSKLQNQPNSAREQMYKVLDQLRSDLPNQPLDKNLSELLYAYYPQGGFYRRHRDAIPGSASTLRKYSLLLYLNQDWRAENGGQLRMHFDSGGDELPPGESPNYRDVDPTGGTLVLFESDKVPHEVLDTNTERVAVVGWYNRPVTAGDIAELSGGDISPVRIIALAVAAGLVTVGLANLL
jgi:SM-20-related protein